jgi:hypothetical protein
MGRSNGAGTNSAVAGCTSVNPQESSKARSHGRPLGVMVEFQDEEMKTFSESSQSVNHCDPAQEPLCDEPPRTCRTTVKQRQKRAEWGSEMHNMLYIQYLQIFRRVVMASERVPVASRPVGMACKVVPVASRQVLIGYELCLKHGFLPDSSLILRRLPLRPPYH